jgi:hypothetical protein
LISSITAALPKTIDRATRAPLEGVRDRIANILDPKFAEPQSNGLGGLVIVGNQW